MNTRTTLVLLSVLTLASCNTESNVEEADDNIIRIKGSDTEYQMVQDLANLHSDKTGDIFEVSGEGTSTGIEAFVKGEAQIANCSRPMYYDEMEEAKSNGINPVPAVIAIDAIALISHPHNKVDSLSTIELQAIFSGEIDNWSQLGGANKEIKFYGRNNKSGTYKFLEDRFVRYEGFSYKMQEMKTNQEILEAVMKDTFAIGYVGAGFLMDENGKPNPDIWAMYLYTEGDNRAYSPYETTAVVNGDYPLVRPLYQYYNGIPQGKLQEFLKFELSDEGQEVIRKHGFFPLTSQFESENRNNGLTF